MHTFGAIVLAVVGIIILNMILMFVSGPLANAIASTTGIVWLPVLIISALSGCAVYGGLYFALKVASGGNSRTTSGVVIGILILGGVAAVFNALQPDSDPLIITITNVLGIGAGILAALLARRHIDDERVSTRTGQS